jgi:hypothetical protein
MATHVSEVSPVYLRRMAACPQCNRLGHGCSTWCDLGLRPDFRVLCVERHSHKSAARLEFALVASYKSRGLSLLNGEAKFSDTVLVP